MKTSFVEGLLVQPMKAKICRECGGEFELEETEPHTIHCGMCSEILERERIIIVEWEKAQGYMEED